jgi:hypothetical protein
MSDHNEEGPRPVRVLIADDEALIRAGFRARSARAAGYDQTSS